MHCLFKPAQGSATLNVVAITTSAQFRFHASHLFVGRHVTLPPGARIRIGYFYQKNSGLYFFNGTTMELASFLQ
ncbi:MAG TPA: hypothetical protein DD459_02425 [Halieaceae bacterium]|jgi:hypothetical protein|nr:hypothetical protein [Halieaceae bacterium]|tara:strand:- start:1965 stop:2186 length:222 start_codon:yes stop_codon:yes gene_type:complete